MSSRDRLVIMVIGVVVMLGAAWFLAVSPERKKEKEAAGNVETARSELSTAERQEASAKEITKDYKVALHDEAAMHVAVPGGQAIPQLIDELMASSEKKDVGFESIAVATGAGAPTSTSTSKSATPEVDDMEEVPFTFLFKGGFFELERLIGRLTGYTRNVGGRTLVVDGRLMTVSAIHLGVEGSETSSSGKACSKVCPLLAGQVTVTAFSRGASSSSSSTSSPATGSSTTSSSTAPTASATVSGGTP